MSTSNCPGCGAEVLPGATFCDNCGYDLRSSAPAASAPALTQAQPAVGTPCPACGYGNVAGATFCENCGAKLGQEAAVPPAPPAPPTYEQPAPALPPPAQPAPAGITGHFSLASGAILTIPAGKTTVVLGREDPVSGIFPEIDLDPHGGQDTGVGRRHAQLLMQAGQLYIEDLNSVNGTAVNKQKLASGQPHPLQPGDEIRLGKLILIYQGS